MSRVRSKTALLVGAAVGVLGLASCGGEDPGAPPPRAPRLVEESEVAASPAFELELGDHLQLTLEPGGEHPGDSGSGGRDAFPLRIRVAGAYRLCVVDDDGEAHGIRLSQDGAVVAEHVHGTPCDPVTLEAGRYTVELEHGAAGGGDATVDTVFFRAAPAGVSHEDVAAAAPTSSGHYGYTPPSAPAPAPADVSPCDDAATMPPAGEVWLYCAANCQGTPIRAGVDTTDTMCLVSGAETYPVSMKVGPDTTALLPQGNKGVSDSNYALGSGWWALWSSTTEGASVRQLPPQGARTHAVRVLHPRAIYEDTVRPNLGRGEFAIVAGNGGWRTTAGVALQRLVNTSTLGGTSTVPTVALGPSTGISYRRLNGTIAFALNDGDQPRDFTASERTAGISSSVRQVWSIRDPGAASDTVLLLATTRSCRYCNLEGQDLSRRDLAGFDLRYANLAGASLRDANLRGAKLDNASFYGGSLIGADCTGASLVGAQLSRAWLGETRFDGANLSDATIVNAGGNETLPQGIWKLYLERAKLVGAKLAGVNAYLAYSHLAGADFSHAHLGEDTYSVSDFWTTREPEVGSFAVFHMTDLSGASFDAATLDGAWISQCDLTGTRFTNLDASSWNVGGNTISRPPNKTDPRTSFAGSTLRADRFYFFAADLRFLDLTRARFTPDSDLAGRDLRKAVLNGADLQYRDLSGTLLDDADLVGAHLNRAVLRDASLERVNARGATFAYADLERADLSNGVFSPQGTVAGAVFSHAFLRDADLTHADLSRARLAGANLYGPGVKVADTNFTGADLSGAYLAGVDFGAGGSTTPQLAGANLRGAVLVEANLAAADLRVTGGAPATLDHARLEAADLGSARLEGVDLTGAAVSFGAGSARLKRLTRRADGVLAYELIDYPFTDATALTPFTDPATLCPDGTSGACRTDVPSSWTSRDPPEIPGGDLDF